MKRIGRFRLHEVIGTGAYATVYRATDEQLDADVALKVLAENHSLNPDIRNRFIEEARRLRRARGPHVIALHDLGDTDTAQPYLVLEWADRGDLARRVADLRRRGVSVGPRDVLDVARSLAGALGVLHRHDLVHRDLAPRNLLLTSAAPGRQATDAAPAAGPADLHRDSGPERVIGTDEQLVLSDLGLSKDLATASGLTVAAGTSGFAPPEQLRSGTVDRRADIWASGALVVWLILGEAPDDDGAWQQGLQRAGWPAASARELARSLDEVPDRRHGDIGEWLAGLEHALLPELPAVQSDGSGGGPAGPGGAAVVEDSASPRTPGSGRARAFRTAASALVLGLALGVAGSALWPSNGPSVATTTLDDGDEQTVVSRDGVTLTLTGPVTADVDERIVLTVEVEGADTWLWVAPDDATYRDEPVLTLVPETAGRATAQVLVVENGEVVLDATHTVQVTDD